MLEKYDYEYEIGFKKNHSFCLGDLKRATYTTAK